MNIYASLTILIWATDFPVTRMIGDQIDQYALALIRCVSASVLLLAIGAFNKISIPKDRNTWIKIIVAGVCGFAIYIVVFSLGLHSITSATSSIIIALVPIMVAIGSRIIYKEKISISGWISIFTAFGGVVVLMCWNGVLSINAGALWTLSAAFLFFIYNMLTRELTKTLTSLEVITYAMTVAAIALLVFVPHTIGVIQTASTSAVLWAVYLGVLPSAVSYFFWAKAMDYADKTSSVTNFMFITPILATILGLIMLHEAPDAGTFIGGGIIIASLIVFNLKKWGCRVSEK